MMERDEERVELDLSRTLKETTDPISQSNEKVFTKRKSPLRQHQTTLNSANTSITSASTPLSSSSNLNYSLASNLWKNSIVMSTASAVTRMVDIHNASDSMTRRSSDTMDNSEAAQVIGDNPLFNWNKLCRDGSRLQFDESLVEERISEFLSSGPRSGSDEDVLDLKMSASFKKMRRENQERSHNSTTGSINNNNNGKSFPCSECHKTFATEVDLKAHVMRHVTQHPYVCLACGKGFKYDHTLDFHIKSQHGVEGSVNLNMKNLGKKSFKSKKDSSVVGENNNLPRSGSLPDNETDSISEDTNTFEDANNNRTTTPGPSSSTTMTPVDFGFPTNFAPRSIQIKSEKVLITMLEGYHPLSEQTYILYKCSLCGFAFPSLEPVVLHVQTIHSNHTTFTCDKCGATFKWRSELQLHDQLHKAMDQQSKSKQFLIPSFLQPNLVVMSPYFGENLPALSNCNVPAPSEEVGSGNKGLNLSLGSKHEAKATPPESVEVPPSCVAVPQRKSSVDIKEEVTENVALLQRSYPSQIVKPVGDIEETAPGQFKCRFCEKTFDRIFSVHRHERVHTGYKPCICKVCGRGFSEKRNLRHHIIRFHSDGSGRELLKRVRKEKSLSAASCLKKAAVKLLSNSLSENAENVQSKEVTDSQPDCAIKAENGGQESEQEHHGVRERQTPEDHQHHHLLMEQHRQQKLLQHQSEFVDHQLHLHHFEAAAGVSSVGGMAFQEQQGEEAERNADRSSSSRRKKSKPSKKVVNVQECSPGSPKPIKVKEEDEEVDESEEKLMPQETLDYSTSKDHMATNVNNNNNHHHNSNNNNCEPENRLHCHGAFFSSYNPRLGIVEKPIKRSLRPILAPDGKYLYPCGYCQKTFCSLSDLNRHMNFHEDVRPFKCQYCDYQSRTNSQLKVHMLRHAGIKQYLCQICNYNGVTQSDLNRHCKTRSHILRSANVCPLCSLGFSTRTLLEDHVLKFHESATLDILNKQQENEQCNWINQAHSDSDAKEFAVDALM